MVALEPWAEAGFRCAAVDIAHPAPRTLHPNIVHVSADIRELASLPGASFVLAWPPCTDLAGSGARWWAEKGAGALDSALDLVHHCRRLAGERPLVVENPVGRLANHWRRPDVIVHPWQFAGHNTTDPAEDAYAKATCLWLENGALPPVKRPWRGVVDKQRIHFCPPGPERAFKRSMTPLGLAVGLFLANHEIARGNTPPGWQAVLPFL